MKYRVGIVGAGHISEFHLHGLGRLECVDVIGITDLAEEAAERRAKQFGIRAFSTLDELLQAKPDAVHVLTPPASHTEVTLRCLEAGCHVFVEKPLATSVGDCDRIIEAECNANRTVGIDHSLLCDPFTQRALQIVRSGKIGNVTNVECNRSQSMPPYEGGPLPEQYQDGGYPFRDLGIHALYQVEAFLGEISDVSWSFQKLGDDTNLEFDDWRITAECERGTAHVHLSWNIRPLQDEIVIQGTRGVIRIDRFGMKVTSKTVGRLPEHPQRLVNAIREGVQTMFQVPLNLGKVVTKQIRRYHGLQGMIADYYQSLSENRPPIATTEDARRIGYWVEQIAAAADRDKTKLVESRQPKQLTAKQLVTGATGFIGGHLIERLLSQSSEPIRILVRRPIPSFMNDNRLEVVVGDLGDPEAVKRAVAGVDRIYHAGGTVEGDKHAFVRGNVVGTQNVVNSAQLHHVKQLIYISSLSVLHSSKFSAANEITESWPLEPKAEARGYYTQTKLDAEKIVSEAAAKHGLPAVILRPAEVIGVGAPLLSPGVARRMNKRLLVLGDGTLQVPLINVHDLVDAINLVAEKSIVDGSIFHLADDQVMTQNQLARKYVEMVECDSPITHVPRWFLNVAAVGVQLLCWCLNRSAPLSTYRLQSALSKRIFDCSKAQQKLGWKPTRGIDEALQETLDAIADSEVSTATHLEKSDLPAASCSASV